MFRCTGSSKDSNYFQKTVVFNEKPHALSACLKNILVKSELSLGTAWLS